MHCCGGIHTNNKNTENEYYSQVKGSSYIIRPHISKTAILILMKLDTSQFGLN